MAGFLGQTGWSWVAEPVSVEVGENSLTWRCRGSSDFWRVTESGIEQHDGQAYLVEVEGDFRLEGVVDAELGDRYDQVGLFVQAGEDRWLKLGAELDGGLWLSAAHTRGESDWSREPLARLPVRLAVERHADTVACSSEVDGSLRMFRQLHLPGPVSVGLFSCSPLGAGFNASVRSAALVVSAG